MPQARLLSLEYAAPASGWEVRSSASSLGFYSKMIEYSIRVYKLSKPVPDLRVWV